MRSLVLLAPLPTPSGPPRDPQLTLYRTPIGRLVTPSRPPSDPVQTTYLPSADLLLFFKLICNSSSRITIITY
jgi:hypothetical protein